MKRASGYLPRRGRSWKAGWRAATRRNTPQKLVWRARIVLMWADGAGVTAIVRATGKTKRTAYRWRERYVERGIDALRQYRQEWDDKLHAFKGRPLHDWASHAADAFRYGAVGLVDRTQQQRRPAHAMTAFDPFDLPSGDRPTHGGLADYSPLD